VALGADTSLRVHGDHYVGFKWAATADEAEPAGVDLAARSLVDARWERRTGRGLWYEGTDFWLVYNEGLDADRDLDRVGRPVGPLSLSRALILKYTHTLTF